MHQVNLAKQYYVLLCTSDKPENSILLVAGNGIYSPDKMPRATRDIRDKYRFITLSVWKQDNEAVSWEPTLLIGLVLA